MFGLFKSRSYSDVHLGEFSLKNSYWRGRIVLDPNGEIPLALAGTRDAPDANALAEAYRLPASFPGWAPSIAQALFEHFEPYGEAIAAGEYPEAPDNVRDIKTPRDALSNSKLQFITVGRISGSMVTELGYVTEWDEEHTLGIRFHDGKFAELCGSTLRV
ncbi:hypothetical protein GM658_19255 [Pseudoduganella eburnea]|uniref:DUF6985 domain-containing protein n=1 Tax=Massilia eburnea TaxID=1776165 RepID=A0A6L6QKE6_9BURK|nr:hypothetical protein [Massilia eburnea]MTW12749.1 hypothetical protein [Massilia eburnea]